MICRTLVAVAAAALASTGARADDAIAMAQRAYADVDYAKCKDEAQHALAAPGDKPARVDAYKYLGLCDAALNDTDKAREAFKRMLAIDHDARLPDGLSPRFTSSFREAKGAFVSGTPLGFTVVDEKLDGATRIIRLKLVDDLELVQKIAWHGAAGSQGPPVRAAPLQEIDLPAAVDVTVVALDAAGGEIATMLLPAKKAATPAAAAAAPPPEEPFPWLVVGGVTAGVIVLAAVGVGVGVLLAPPQSVTLKTDVVFGP